MLTYLEVKTGWNQAGIVCAGIKRGIDKNLHLSPSLTLDPDCTRQQHHTICNFLNVILHPAPSSCSAAQVRICLYNYRDRHQYHVPVQSTGIAVILELGFYLFVLNVTR